MGSNSERPAVRPRLHDAVTPRDLIVLIKSPLHSLRVQSLTAICLLISFPDELKDSVGDDAYERRDNQYHQELTHDFMLLVQSIDPF